MIVILEGPDGGGKTTIAEELKKTKPGTRVIHHGAYAGQDKIFVYYLASLLYAHRRPHLNVIFDRSWLSEAPYGRVMRGGQDRLGSLKRVLERIALGLGAIVVNCLPSPEVLKNTYAKRSSTEYPDSERKLMQVRHEYAQLRTELPMILFDRGRQTFTALLTEIVRQTYTNGGPGIGSWKPGVTLMVGEQLGASHTRGWPSNWAFCGSAGCSPWFAAELDRLRVSERTLYWVNALDSRSRPTSFDFVEGLKPSRIIALGKVASSVLDDIPHIEIEHPQHHKRFHFNDRWVELEEALGKRIT